MRSLHGMPTQAAYDNALATAQLVLVRLFPAFNVSRPGASSDVALMIPGPPPLSAGLTTPLPASFTGDNRVLDEDDIVQKGVEALEALRVKLRDRSGSPWALGALCVRVCSRLTVEPQRHLMLSWRRICIAFTGCPPRPL